MCVSIIVKHVTVRKPEGNKKLTPYSRFLFQELERILSATQRISLHLIKCD
jgi:hypothetical protein